VTTRPRSDLLTTEQQYNLDRACEPINRAFDGGPPYLVGSAMVTAAPSDQVAGEHQRPPRDVDVRLMLDASEFAKVCPTQERWELLCLAITTYLRDRTGLPIDFQIQSAEIANSRFNGFRNPLGMGRGMRVYAGGGDATPGWQPSA
jgi:hypothetical protein